MKEDVRVDETNVEDEVEDKVEDKVEDEERRESLFEEEHASELQTRWSDVQGRFVDDPREAVKAADALVEEVIRDLSSLFSTERAALERQLGAQEKVSTEDLRVALRRYRSFFQRLLSA